MKPRYTLMVDEHSPIAIANDEESQRGLFLLIEQNSGIERIAAQNLLDTGKMLVTENLIVAREDFIDRLQQAKALLDAHHKLSVAEASA